MAIDKKVIDQLLADYKKPEDIIGENGLLKELTKAILERALEAEMTDHLGYEKHDPAGHHRGNTRNGKSPKTLKGDFGELDLETPRDRKATFDPKIVAKGQTRWTGFDDKIISMYARGEGDFDRVRRWAKGISGSHRSGVSAHRSAVVHRAFSAGLAELRVLESAQAGGGGSAVDLSRSHGG